jgi:hypothetical protein
MKFKLLLTLAVALIWSLTASVAWSQNTWYFDDSPPAGWGNGTPPIPFWEPMDFGPLEGCVFQDLANDSPRYGCTALMNADFSGYHFYADIWLAYNTSYYPDSVWAELRTGTWGSPDPGPPLGRDSVLVTHTMGSPGKYTFDFGTIPTLVLSNKSLIVVVIYPRPAGNIHIYWNGPDCPSALHATGPGGDIPTLTEWGLIIFGVVLLGFITWVFLKRRKVIGVRSKV